ncbi:MAG: hypothetical protein U1F11_01485 [Steroidobacteraceae bacterium]
MPRHSTLVAFALPALLAVRLGVVAAQVPDPTLPGSKPLAGALVDATGGPRWVQRPPQLIGFSAIAPCPASTGASIFVGPQPEICRHSGSEPKEFLVEASTTMGPISIGLEAGALASALELAPAPAPTSTGATTTVTSNSAAIAAALEATRTARRLLRFTPAASNAPSGAYEVTLTASDRSGVQASFKLTVHVVQPAVTGLRFSAVGGASAWTPGFLIYEVAGFGSAKNWRFQSVASNCGWAESDNFVALHEPRDVGPVIYSDRPTVTLSRGGMFGRGPQALFGSSAQLAIDRKDTADHTCKVAAVVQVQIPALAASSPFTFRILPASGVSLRGRHLLTMAQTFGLQDRLKFTPSPDAGGCRGESSMPGQPSYSVGIVDHQGDLSASIRSGPIGTRCSYASATWLLANGVYLESLDARRDHSAACEQGSSTPSISLGPTFQLTRGALNPNDGMMYSSFEPEVTIDGVVHTLRQSGGTQYRSSVLPFGVTLDCGVTLVNDHFSRWQIDSVVFSLPASTERP